MLFWDAAYEHSKTIGKFHICSSRVKGLADDLVL